MEETQSVTAAHVTSEIPWENLTERVILDISPCANTILEVEMLSTG